MRIIFICGCLESGKDGVGDYTLRLSKELLKVGHHIFLIAINDKYVDKKDHVSLSNPDSEPQIFRLSSSIPYKKRIQIIKNLIDLINPEWISLQYVIFAYHDKGLPFQLAAGLKKAGREVKWHIMFHELWVRDKAFKFLILGFLQKKIIQNMIWELNPHIIHTHLPIYFNDLLKYSKKVYELSLFSNFKSEPSLNGKNMDLFRVVFFNQVKDDEKIFEFLIKLYTEVSKNNLQFEILLIGNSSKLQSFGNKITSISCFSDKTKYLGFLENHEISEILNSCSLGISPMTISELGKSGTIAAFLSHGLPIGIPITDKKDKPFFNKVLQEVLVIEPNLNQIKKASIAANRLKMHNSVLEISKVFINDLASINELKE